MSVNNYRIKILENDQSFKIPILTDFNFVGKNDLVEVYEDEVVEEIINPIEDFEVTRYSHKPTQVSNSLKTNTDYKFHFFDRTLDVENTNSSHEVNWVCDYNYSSDISNEGIVFSDKELYYYVNSFRKSFFKLDLYSSNDIEDQKNYITIIIPTQQGITKTVDIGTNLIPNEIEVKTPNFSLDFIGDKEGYFIYWLKEPIKYDITEFYMSAKFFNAKTGQFTRMLNTPQSNIPQKFNFNKSKYFFYKVILDYQNYEYMIYNTNNFKREGCTTPIKWYEYINP